MNFLVDSSGWIEFFSGGPKAGSYARFLGDSARIIVPSLVIYEVYRKVKKTLGEDKAIFAATQMQRGIAAPMDDRIALFAADVSLRHHLAMADSIVYATALLHKARLVTSDNDFRDLPDVEMV